MLDWVKVALVRLQTVDVRETLKRQDGQTVTEYGLVLAFVALALGAILILLKGQISTFISKVGADLGALPGF